MINHRYSDRNSLFGRMMDVEKKLKTSPFAVNCQLQIICLGKIKQQYNVSPHLSYTVICSTIAKINYSCMRQTKHASNLLSCYVSYKYVIVPISHLFVSYIYTQFKVLEKVFGIRILFTGSPVVEHNYQVLLWIYYL